MNKELLELREKALTYFREMRIADGEAEINQILLDLSETDEKDLEIKLKTLKNIHDYLLSKSKLKHINSDLTFLQQLSNKLKLDYDETIMELRDKDNTLLDKLLEIIKRNY